MKIAVTIIIEPQVTADSSCLWIRKYKIILIIHVAGRALFVKNKLQLKNLHFPPILFIIIIGVSTQKVRVLII